jgi:hypothetical protein
VLRTTFLNNEISIQRSNFLSILGRLQSALPIVLVLLSPFSWEWSHAQSDSGVERVSASVTSHQTQVNEENPLAVEPGQAREKPNKLSTFFKIGILINALILLLFAAWVIREWKKNGKKSGENGQ